MSSSLLIAKHLIRLIIPAALAAGVLSGAEACAGPYYLRAGAREWSDFPAQAPARLECRLDAPAGARTLVLRQDDVKRQDWVVAINGHALGKLVADEHRQMRVFDIPAGALRGEANVLTIATTSALAASDDIRIDRIAAREKESSAWLSEGRVKVRVLDGAGHPIPARITFADSERTLLPTGAGSRPGVAARMGTVFTSTGEAEIPVPAGEYGIWASRGFEYSTAQQSIRLQAGETRELSLRIQREIRVPGWTAGDPHIHTLERSGHGDASVAERVVTIQGEGLDWAVSTEHNLASTFPAPGAAELGFIAIPGCEMTTSHGHFNVFPWAVEGPIPDPKSPWDRLWQGLHSVERGAIIWNHPRDSHSGYRPFAKENFIATAGETVGPFPFDGSGMEVVNSGAMYTHPLQLAVDWMRLLNRGRRIAAIGSSDSHTVTTFFVGQARTYVHTGVAAPSAQSVATAIHRGETAVSYGLLTFLEQQNGRLIAKVYGPSWSRAQRLLIYANGELIQEQPIAASKGGGLQWTGEVKPLALRQDAFLVAIAVGGDVAAPFWPISRPYQPVSLDWTPMTVGISPALRWDGNGDGRFQTPREQAEAIMSQGRINAGTNVAQAIAAELQKRDAAVAVQAALLLAQEGRLPELLATELPVASRERVEQFAAEWSVAQKAQPAR